MSQTLENQIATVLWQWKFAKRDQRESLLIENEFESLLEHWFPFSSIAFTRERGIWCDGVPLYEIKSFDRLSFAILGVGYFPCDYAPFELEFYFNRRRDPVPSCIVLRFGLLDTHGELRLIGHSKHPSHVLAMRPTENADWAVAVELRDEQSDVTA